MQPLAEYSCYVMEESVTSPGAEPETQYFLKLFFSLRDSNEDRYKAEASELLARKVLLSSKDGVVFNYQLKNREVHCTTSPAFINAFDCPLSDQKLGLLPRLIMNSTTGFILIGINF